MRVIEVDQLVGQLAPDLREWKVQLTGSEIEKLKAARNICETAGKLQASILEKMGIEDDGRDNGFEWARIYLDSIC